MSLSLCILLYGDPAVPVQRGSRLVCVWGGFKHIATLKEMKMCIEKPDSVPPVGDKRVPLHPLRKRGKMPLHPHINNERHLHLAKFCSFVPLHNVTSPARIVALYVTARLFPRRWRAIYAGAFHGEQLDKRAAATVDRFNAVMTEPDYYELIEMADLHTAYQRPATREARFATENPLQSFFTAMKPLVCHAFATENQKSATTYQLTSFLAIAHVALNRSTQKGLVQFLDQHSTCTKRQLRAFEAAWLGAAPTLPSEGFVAGVIGQFTLLK